MPVEQRGRAGAVMLAVVVGVGSGCAWISPSSPTELHLTEGSEVEYVLGWSDDGGTRGPDGTLLFSTKLGYEVGLEAVYVGSGALELVPCRPKPPGAAWWRRLGPESAYAAHSATQDASHVSEPRLEQFRDGETAYGVASASGAAYCRLHYLMVPVPGEASDGFSVERASAYLRGWYRRTGDKERQPFEASVKLRGGAVVDLLPAPVAGVESLVGADGKAIAARVVLTRRPARAFDRLEFSELEPIEIAYEFLRRLGQTSEATFVVSR